MPHRFTIDIDGLTPDQISDLAEQLADVLASYHDDWAIVAAPIDPKEFE